MTGCFFYKSWYSWKKVFCPSSLTGSWLILALFISKEFCLPTTNSHPPKRLVGILLGSVQSLSHVQQHGHAACQPHEQQHTRFPCPSPTPGACSNSWSLSWWCHPTISSSVISFFSCFQSFPASGSFPMSQFFASGGQIIGVSASASVLPVTIQDWPLLGWAGWISFAVQGTLKSLLQHLSSKASIFQCSAFFIV